MGNQKLDAACKPFLVDCLCGKLTKLLRPVGDWLLGEQGWLLP